MQNAIQNFMQSSIVFEKPGILSKKLKTLTSSNYHRVEYKDFFNFSEKWTFSEKWQSLN